jgi:hypothetical protein
MVLMDVYSRRIVGFGVAPANLDESAGCSIARSRGRLCLGNYLRTMIRCFAFIAGERTFGYSKSMRSRPFPQRPVRMLSSSGRSEPSGASVWIGSGFGTSATSNGSSKTTSVLQSISLSHRTDRGDTGAAERRTRATARVLRLLQVATALRWIISDPQPPRELEFDTDRLTERAVRIGLCHPPSDRVEKARVSQNWGALASVRVCLAQTLCGRTRCPVVVFAPLNCQSPICRNSRLHGRRRVLALHGRTCQTRDWQPGL